LLILTGLFCCRCSVTSADNYDAENVQLQQQTAPVPTDLVAPTISKKVDSPGNKHGNISALHREEAKALNEVVQLKRTIATLEERMRCMERDNEEKLKDVCGVLFSQKLEIQRLQEIIWALHPNIDLDSAFTVDDKASYLGPDLNVSLASLNAEED
jgi:chromosome segregation ATPase